tara:strand:+ start:36532 stop:37716 length:1185 start_codon:yes stop_codon:yes gene_type:complete
MNRLKKNIYAFSLMSIALLSVQCKSDKKKDMEVTPQNKTVNMVTISKEAYGLTLDSIVVDKYLMKNEKGMEISVITYGGIITSWTAPDRNNNYKDIVLGYDTLEQYEKETPYFGALIGRYGNRIAKGKFSLDGTEYTLETNDGPNHLHGGVKGFDKVVWNASETKTDTTASLVLTYLSKDMEEGYPGNLETKVTYTLTNDNELQVVYEATTDKKTVVNLTQHTYFNLTGDFSKTILDHEITINADKLVPVDATLIPTGALTDVVNTPFDFREAKTIGKEINTKNEQLERGLGYDHCWVLNNQNEGVRLVSSAYEKESGRQLDVYSDEIGIQLYTGNFLDGTLPNKQGGKYAHRTGFCLETQHYPDSPNQENFPTTVLNPGEKYISKTSFKFSAK